MAGTSATDRLLVEIGVLRQELAELRKEQQELARSVGDLALTFKALAVQLGIASDPYRKGGAEPKGHEIPGFG